MAEAVRLEVEPPAHGWATVRLSAPGVELAFAASHAPWDSIGDLAGAAAGLVARVPGQTVAWSTEPVEYEFRFVTAGDRTRWEVHEFPDRRRRWRRAEVPVATVEAGRLAVAGALWRCLRRLQGAVTGEEFAAGWGHPFPVEIVERLGDQLRGHA